MTTSCLRSYEQPALASVQLTTFWYRYTSKPQKCSIQVHTLWVLGASIDSLTAVPILIRVQTVGKGRSGSTLSIYSSSGACFQYPTQDPAHRQAFAAPLTCPPPVCRHAWPLCDRSFLLGALSEINHPPYLIFLHLVANEAAVAERARCSTQPQHTMTSLHNECMCTVVL